MLTLSNGVEDQEKAYLRVVPVSEEEFQSTQALLYRDLEDSESLLDGFSYLRSDIEFMFMIPQNKVAHRAMMFDSLHKAPNVTFCSTEDIWSPLKTLENLPGSWAIQHDKAFEFPPFMLRTY